MQIWQLFIILRQPVTISVTVFSNLTKLTTDLLTATILQTTLSCMKLHGTMMLQKAKSRISKINVACYLRRRTINLVYLLKLPYCMHSTMTSQRFSGTRRPKKQLHATTVSKQNLFSIQILTVVQCTLNASSKLCEQPLGTIFLADSWTVLNFGFSIILTIHLIGCVSIATRVMPMEDHHESNHESAFLVVATTLASGKACIMS